MVRLRMSNPAKNEMDVDAFLAWAEGRDGRWELRDGEPVLMSPEHAAHALTKYAAQKALENGIERAGLPCRMFPDGMTVRITARAAFEPDGLVVCPPPTDLNTMESRTRSSLWKFSRRARLRTITGSSSTAISRCRA
jgi:Uma2 family endonuclease